MIGATITRCSITGKPGQGGMGEVYRATDTMYLSSANGTTPGAAVSL